MARMFRNLGAGLLRGATADVLGMPVDTLNMIRQGLLAPAEGGNPMARSLTGLLGPVQQTGSSDYFAQQMGLPQGEGPAYEMARMVSPSPTDLVALARKTPKLDIWIGPKAKTWNAEAATKAEKMEAEGIDPREIWRETGTWKGPDGMWRQEIDDSAAQISNTALDAISNSRKGYFEGPINAALMHDELYKSYPDIGEMNSGFFASELPEGSYNGNTIVVRGPGAEAQRSTALHELQHAIQNREGWAQGGSSINAPIIANRAKNDLLSEFQGPKSQFDSLYGKALELSNANYLKMLKGLSEKQNIRPSDITNLSPWYEYSSEIRGLLGPMPKKAGPNRDRWLRGAAERMLYREKEKSPYPEYKIENYLNEDTKSLKNEYKKVSRQMDKYKEGARKYSDIEKKFNDISKMSDYEQYRRLAGEAEARATQSRIMMNAADRKAIFPSASYDVPEEQLIIPQNKSLFRPYYNR